MPEHEESIEYKGKYYKTESEKSTGDCEECAFYNNGCYAFRNALNRFMYYCAEKKVIFVEIDPMLATLLEVKKIAEEEDNA